MYIYIQLQIVNTIVHGLHALQFKFRIKSNMSTIN